MNQKRYSEAERRTIVAYALRTSVVTASRKYGCAVSTIAGWDEWKNRDKASPADSAASQPVGSGVSCANQAGAVYEAGVPPDDPDIAPSDQLLPAEESIAKHFTYNGYKMQTEMAECETQLEVIVSEAEIELAEKEPETDVLATLLTACVGKDAQRLSLAAKLTYVPLEDRIGAAYDSAEAWNNSTSGQAWNIICKEFTAAVGENDLLEYTGDGTDNSWQVNCPDRSCLTCSGVITEWRCIEKLLQQRTDRLTERNA